MLLVLLGITCTLVVYTKVLDCFTFDQFLIFNGIDIGVIIVQCPLLSFVI